MQSHKKFLFVTNGLRDEQAALREMYDLVGGGSIDVTILAATPTIPGKLAEYVADFEQKVIDRLNATHSAAVPAGSSARPITCEIIHADQPFLAIMQKILVEDYDAVVKAAEPTNRDSGYAALDMSLLRKCPQPLWLLKKPAAPGADSSGQFLVAIDPVFAETNARLLSIALLREADFIASRQSATIRIVACWTSPLGVARNNAFLHITEADVEREASEVRDEHYNTLVQLIEASRIQSPCEIVQLNGDPAPTISAYSREIGSRILLMGTVARTGIPGFIMGNTAENIIHELSCSIIAIKPPGFVCPIKLK